MPKILTSKGLSYKILFTIKESPTKQIYKALRKESTTGAEQEVLLKVFSQEEKSYNGELESLLQSNSNYCVRLLTFEAFAKKRALVLEYIHGISLSQLIQTFSLSEIEIQTILISIYKGLVDLKKQGLAHGDLSLDNILIDKDVQIKFIDFGKGNYQSASLGTFPFIAPEIIQGSRSNFLSDLFSLGVIETFLKNPSNSLKLQQQKAEDFISTTNPLLASDPQDRAFSSETLSSNKEATSIRTLSYKVRDFLHSMESKRYETKKISTPSKYFLNVRHLTRQIAILFIVGIFAGAYSFSDLNKNPGGFLKISTNKWFLIRLKTFKAYAPFDLSVSAGWHLLSWETATAKGIKIIHIKSKEILLLNDKDFLGTNND